MSAFGHLHIHPRKAFPRRGLGHLSPKPALQMFIGMFASVQPAVSRNADLHLGDDGIIELTLEFSSHIPKYSFTPAQIHGICFGI
jgi:hypothetical protein